METRASRGFPAGPLWSSTSNCWRLIRRPADNGRSETCPTLIETGRALQVLRVLLVLLTDVLGQLAVGLRAGRKGDFERFRVHNGIVDGGLDDQGRSVRA